jgi:hypothetical protein
MFRTPRSQSGVGTQLRHPTSMALRTYEPVKAANKHKRDNASGLAERASGASERQHRKRDGRGRVRSRGGPKPLPREPDVVRGSHVTVGPGFARLREEFLIDFKYSTARAYWADLQDDYEWATSCDRRPRAISAPDRAEYAAQLRLRGYSVSTVRRRESVIRRFGEFSHALT